MNLAAVEVEAPINKVNLREKGGKESGVGWGKGKGIVRENETEIHCGKAATVSFSYHHPLLPTRPEARGRRILFSSLSCTWPIRFCHPRRPAIYVSGCLQEANSLKISAHPFL